MNVDIMIRKKGKDNPLSSKLQTDQPPTRHEQGSRECHQEDCIQELNILPNHQFASKKGLGTELKVVTVVEGINQGFLKKDVTETILLDVEKAFDRVWREGLL